MDAAPPPPSPVDRFLRAAMVIDFFVSFALLFPHGIWGSQAMPAIGIIPYFFSSVVGIVALCNRLRSRFVCVWLDNLLAIFSIAILVPSWVNMAEGSSCRWSSLPEPTMLASYGTAPLMLNLYVANLARVTVREC